jgi:MFS superfamily sulfate permease-like transporter
VLGPEELVNLRFDRNEWAGSFGDVGTDLPLLLGIVLASGLDAGHVFAVFGLLQIATGLLYGLPMPMQPLKAMAVLVISQKIAGGVLLGGGLAVGLVMLLLTLTGGLDVLARWIPRSVVRGIQFGLGLSLASLALKTYIPSMGRTGWMLAAAGVLAMLLLWGNRRVPGGLLLVALGAAFALWNGLDLGKVFGGLGLSLPSFHLPSWGEVWRGFWLLALPQIPLSLSNSVIATHQTLQDLFPERRVGVKKIGLTYSLVNLLAPLLGGVPACHGCGGLCGHYAFGARTGGSVVLYGAFYLLTGLFLSSPLQEVVKIFPQPVLGVILLFEALALMAFLRDTAASGRDFAVALLTGIVAFAVPQGFVAGLLLGTLVFYGIGRYGAEAGRGPAAG